MSMVSKKARKTRGTRVEFHANPEPGWTRPALAAGASTSGAGSSTSGATLCTREVVEIYRRALADGDDEQVHVFRSIRNQT
jgi:hypothetical protein